MPSQNTARQASPLDFRLTVVAIVLCCHPVARAQLVSPVGPPVTESMSPSGPHEEASARRSVVEQQPRTIYVPDAQGKPVPLINIPLETIQRLLNQRDGLPATQQPPAFQINRLRMRGTAHDGYAELNVDLEVTVLTPQEGERPVWTALPLRFHESSLLAPPVHEGDGQLHLSFSEKEGYQGWLRHQRPGDHRLRLKLAVPLRQAAGSTQLSFFPPLANQSELEFMLSETGVTAKVENARNLTKSTADQDRTRLRIEDLRNQVVLTWRQGGSEGTETPTYLDVRGDIRVTIDGPGAIRSNATFDLQSYGRPVEQFSLRLPPDTKIVSGNQPGYTISELNLPDDEPHNNRATVQIKLENPASKALVQLVTQTTSRADATDKVNVASFEVIGAIRQAGRVSLLTSEEWLVYWTLGPSVRRVQSLEEFETIQGRRLLASFQYFQQPCLLDVQIRTQSTRIAVEPAYWMRVSEDRLSLEAQLNYRIRGAPISFLNFALNGWQLNDVGPSGIVENDDFQGSGGNPIKLRLAKATSGDLSLTLNLHRPIRQPKGTLRFPLPWPAADAMTPGSLLVSTADSIVVNYQLQQMTGLVQDQLLATRLTPFNLAETSLALPTAFRFMTDRALGNVVMDYEVRTQELRVRSDTVMELSSESAQVSQRLAYRILYEPASRLQLEVPPALFELLANPRFRNLVDLRLDGQSLAPAALQEILDNAENMRDRELVPLDISFDRAKLGSVNLELRFQWPLRPLGTAAYTAIPLATPRGAELTSNTATLTPVGTLGVEPSDDGNWRRDPDLVPSASLQTIGMSSPSRPNLLRLRVAQRRDEDGDDSSTSATVIQRAWLQTWLADQQRMDRAVYRLVTDSNVITLELPSNVEQTTTLVDGQEVVAVRTGDRLAVPLAGNGGGARQHTLEVSLTFASRPALGSMRFTAPELMDAIGPRRWFWQLLVPSDEHLLTADPGLTSANRWARKGWIWRRHSAQPQSQLEYWTNATPQPSLPTGLNQYLFSSFVSMERLQVRTCRRSTMVFGASASALGIGLALLYWPGLRHPATLLLMAVALLSATWLYSDAALLISQASLLGVFLASISALVSMVLQRLSGPAHSSHWLGRRTADSHSDTSSVRSDGSRPPHSTISAPAVPAIAPDSKA